MSKWEMVKLGEVCDVRDGTHDSPKYVDNGYPLITSKNVVDGYIDITNVNLISEDDYRKIIVRSGVDNGDIIMPMIGTIGNPVVVNKTFDFAIKNVALIKFINNKVLNKYIFYILKSYIFKKYIEKVNRGGTQKFISLGDIRDFLIPLPPFEIQKQIAKTLDTADKLLTLRKQQLTELDNLIKSIFYDMFGDPVTNEKRLDVSTLDDVCEKITDGTHQTPEYSDSGYIFLSSKNVTSGYIDWNDVKYIPDDLHKELYKRLKPKKNDILLAKNGTTGVAAIVDRDCIFDIYVSLALLRPISTINPVYLLKAINSDACKYQFDMNLKGIGVPNLHLNMIKKVKILVPKIELQNQFAHIVAKIEEQKALVKKAIDETQYLFDSLMSEYFD